MLVCCPKLAIFSLLVKTQVIFTRFSYPGLFSRMLNVNTFHMVLMLHGALSLDMKISAKVSHLLLDKQRAKYYWGSGYIRKENNRRMYKSKLNFQKRTLFNPIFFQSYSLQIISSRLIFFRKHKRSLSLSALLCFKATGKKGIEGCTLYINLLTPKLIW
jgi:hypothetical protein